MEGDVEQWPYRVKFHQTNVYGNTNNNTYPTAINDLADDRSTDTSKNANVDENANNVYTLDGRLVRRGSTSLDGLPRGIYVVGGRKVMK